MTLTSMPPFANNGKFENPILTRISNLDMVNRLGRACNCAPERSLNCTEARHYLFEGPLTMSATHGEKPPELRRCAIDTQKRIRAGMLRFARDWSIGGVNSTRPASRRAGAGGGLRDRPQTTDGTRRRILCTLA